MILIFSSPDDQSTHHVIEWLIYYKCKFVRINLDDEVRSILCYFSEGEANFKIQFSRYLLKSDKISFFWYRRGRLSFTKSSLEDESVEVLDALNENLSSNWGSIRDFIFDKLESIPFLGDYKSEINNDKLADLSIAQKVGLYIPATLVTSSKSDAIDFIQKHDSVITKDLRYPISMHFSNMKLTSVRTRIITKKNLDIYNNSFAPSLFQEEIKKLFEIRIFFIRESIFSMAIFSQNDDQTKLDFRNYNYKKQNRFVPFSLPSFINKRIRDFIKESNLSTGSIDMIYGIDRRYYFLEVNPCGQFGFLSQYCNYNLEKIIANYILNNEIT